MKGFDPKDNNLDHALTFDEWNRMGFWIKKGSKAACFSPDHKALFTPSQVNPPKKQIHKTKSFSTKESFCGTPYYREHEIPPGAYDTNRLPCSESMDYFMSQLNPTHHVMRQLENHLDSIFEKHHGGYMHEEDFY